MERVRRAGVRRRQLEGRLAAVRRILAKGILPRARYFSYVEITRRDPQALWINMKSWPTLPDLRARRIPDMDDIYPVFRELFRKKVVAA